MFANLEQAVTIARESNDRIGEGFGILHVAMVHQMRGDLRAAEEQYLRALNRGVSAGDPLLISYARTYLAVLRQLRGEHARAAEELQAALEHSQNIGNEINEATALIHLGISCRASGRLDLALDHLHQAHALARKVTDADLEAKSLNELGTCLHGTEPQQAIVHHEQALAITLTSGNLLERARAHQGLAHCHAVLGNLDANEQHHRMTINLRSRLSMVPNSPRTPDEL